MPVRELTITAVAGCPHLGHKKFLERWLPRAIENVRRAPAEISVALLGDAKMAALHKQFLNIPVPTDVLTFELEYDTKGNVTAGEVVVCVSHASREAKKRRVAIEHEILLYALHGVLHLSGYDDLNPEDHARMHAEEDRILRAIGIGSVFAAEGSTRGESFVAAGGSVRVKIDGAMPAGLRRRLRKS